jgi:hypothetical protein
MTLCPCGRPLHYTNALAQQIVEESVARSGPTVRVVCGTDAYEVDRHYLALHGLKARELPMLAVQGLIKKVAEVG